MRYDFEEKQKGYRVPVWTAVDSMIRKPRIARTVAYLDTGQGLETRHLLNLHYHPNNLHAINRVTAEVATLTRGLRRDKMPDICTHGQEFIDAVEDIGPLDVLSFDGVSNIGGEVCDTLLTHAVHAARPKVITFTILVGRERAGQFALLKSQAGSLGFDAGRRTSSGKEVDAAIFERVRWVLWAATGIFNEGVCLAHVTELKWDVYRSSSRQTMAWCVARLEPHETLYLTDPQSFIRKHHHQMRCWLNYGR